MPIMQFNCPSCHKQHVAYVDANISINCDSCGTRIKPYESGMVDIVKEAAKRPLPETTISKGTTTNKAAEEPVDLRKTDRTIGVPKIKEANPSSSSGSTDDFSYSIWPFILGVLIVVAYYGWTDFLKPRQTSNSTIINHQPVQYPKQTPTYQKPTTNPPKAAEQQSPTSQEGIVYLHTVNSFQGTDKTEKCSSVLDESSQTLNLKSIDHPANTFKLIYQEGGVCTFQYYSNDILEAEKSIRRRSDLESGNGTLIYTSRTGELIISLSY